MSQKNSRRLHGSGGVISYFLRFQDLKKYDQRVQKTQFQGSFPISQEQLQSKHCSLRGRSSVDSSTSGLGSGEIICLSRGENSRRYQSVKKLLAEKEVSSPYSCASDVYFDRRGSTTYSFLEDVCVPEDLGGFCAIHLQNNENANEVCKSKENSSDLCSKGDSNCHQERGTNSSVNGMKTNCISGKTISNNGIDGADELSEVSDRSRKPRESSSCHPVSEYQRVDRDEPHSTHLSKKCVLSTMNPIYNSQSPVPHSQTELQKSRSSVTVHRSFSPTKVCCKSFDLNIVTPDGAWTYESTQDITSERRDSPDISRLNRDLKNASQRCQSLCKLNASSNHTSLTFRRFPQQESRDVSSDQPKRERNNVKELQQKFTPRQYQESTVQIAKNSNTKERQLHKIEKPYRQWHRVSRVVTADTRFIISPYLPNDLWHKGTVTKIPSLQKVDSQVGDREIQRKIETNPSLDENPEFSVVTNGHDSFHSMKMCYDRETSTVNTESACSNSETLPSLIVTENQHVESDVHDTDCDTSISASTITLCAMPLHDDQDDAPVDEIESSSTLTDDKCNNAANLDTHPTCEVETVCRGIIVSHTSEPSFSNSRNQRPEKTLASLRNADLAKIQYRNQHTKEHKGIVDCFRLSGETINTVNPPGLVTESSQIIGPLIFGLKSETSVDYSKVVLSAVIVPKLRTAERHRTRNVPSNEVSRFTEANRAYGTSVENNCTTFPMPRVRPVFSQKSKCYRHGSRSPSIAGKKTKMLKKNQPAFRQKDKANANIMPGKDESSKTRSHRNKSNSCDANAQQENKTMSGNVLQAARKLLHKVSRAGLHVHWSEADNKYVEVQATVDYNGSLPGQLSFTKGQIIKQRSFINRSPGDNMSYGYYRVGRLRKKMKGLFPSNTVTCDDPATDSSLTAAL